MVALSPSGLGVVLCVGGMATLQPATAGMCVCVLERCVWAGRVCGTQSREPSYVGDRMCGSSVWIVWIVVWNAGRYTVT